MPAKIVVPLAQLLMSISHTIDLMSQKVGSHHNQVAFIALQLAAAMGLSSQERQDILFASALHDIGAFSLQERLDLLDFEADRPLRHSFIGYKLLYPFNPLRNAAELIHYHHVYWKKGAGRYFDGMLVPMGSHVIHLADRIAVLIHSHGNVLQQKESLVKQIAEAGEALFQPDVLAAFSHLAQDDFFWQNAQSPKDLQLMVEQMDIATMELDMDALLDLAHLFSYITDFRSRFTSTHASGVAAVAKVIAELNAFSAQDCQAMKVAGYFHDIGKLAIPVEIIEKPGKLTSQEEYVMKTHAFHSYQILGKVPALKTIKEWSAFHHEKLDGSGYPFCHKSAELSLGTRIMAVADIFTALNEERPYRLGMHPAEVRNILADMAKNNLLDPAVVILVDRYFAEINAVRSAAQEAARRKYTEFIDEVVKGPKLTATKA